MNIVHELVKAVDQNIQLKKELAVLQTMLDDVQTQLHNLEHRHKNDEAANRMLQEAYESTRKRLQNRCEQCKLVAQV